MAAPEAAVFPCAVALHACEDGILPKRKKLSFALDYMISSDISCSIIVVNKAGEGEVSNTVMVVL